MNHTLLKMMMKDKGVTYEALASELGVSLTTFANKINAKKHKERENSFYIEEVNAIKEYMQLSPEEVLNIFFK